MLSVIPEEEELDGIVMMYMICSVILRILYWPILYLHYLHLLLLLFAYYLFKAILQLCVSII